MKFIRDIIGEKRQSDPSIAGMRMATVPGDEAQVPDGSPDVPDAILTRHNENTIEASGPEPKVQTPSQPQNDDHADLGTSEEVAKFFADSEDPNLFLDEYDDSFGEYEDVKVDVPDPSAFVSTGADEVHDQETAPRHTADADPKDYVQEDELSGATLMHDTPGESDKTLKEALIAEEMAGEQDGANDQRAYRAEPATSTRQFAKDTETTDAGDTVPRPRAEMPGRPPHAAVPLEPTMQAEPAPNPAAEPRAAVEVPQPAVGRGASRHGRVKTRLLGFNTAMETDTDPISNNDQAGAAPYASFPVGWLIVVDGPGRGSAFTLFQGVSTIGRGEDQTVRLDFGDNSISRVSHASIAYDDRQKGFFIGHGGKANIVRRNDRPVLSTEELAAGDTITIGETSLRFVPLCCQDFSWDRETEAGRADAKQG